MMSNNENLDLLSNSSYSFNKKQSQIIQFLDEYIDDGVEYVKSKRIAKNIQGLSAKEVGSNMIRISEGCEGLKIDRWSDSSDITWRIERKEKL